MCITLFCTFLCRFCTARAWKCLISLFMESVNKKQQNFIPLSEEGFTYIWHSRWVRIITIKTERMLIQFLHDVLISLVSLDLKVPVGRDNMEHTLYRSVWCSGSSLHCLCYRQCLCDISNGYLLTWWNRSDWWLTDLKVCSLRCCPLLLCWQKQDITINTVYHSCLLVCANIGC